MKNRIALYILTTLLLAIFLVNGGCVFNRDTQPERNKATDAGSSGAEAKETPENIIMTAASLGPEDVFEIRVFQEPDLSSIYRVSNDGSINFPLIGKLLVAGKTPNEVEMEIRKRLEADFLKQAYVSVLIKEFNSKKVFIFGQVKKPGTFRFEENMTIIQAVTLAGGFTQTAAKNAVSITRLVDGEETRVLVEVEQIWKGKQSNVMLKPGDIIFIPETLF